MMQLIDAHLHIPLTQEVIASASRANVIGCILNSTDQQSWADVARQAPEGVGNDQIASSPATGWKVCASYGTHPWWAGKADMSTVGPALEAQLHAHPTAPVGEVGLDKGKKGLAQSTWEAQLDVFRAHLDIAARHDRPVSVHCVQCHSELAQEFEAFARAGARLPGVLLHSWGGPPDSVHRIQAALSSTTPVVASIQGSIVISASNAWRQYHDGGSEASTYPRGASKHALSCVHSLPLSMLAIETDSPDQPFLQDVHPGYLQWAARVLPWEGEEDEPVLTAGQPNSPAHLVHVWRALTLLRADHALDTRTPKDKARGVARAPSLFSLYPAPGDTCVSLGKLSAESEPTEGQQEWVPTTRALGKQVAHHTTNNVLRVFSRWSEAQELRCSDPS